MTFEPPFVCPPEMSMPGESAHTEPYDRDLAAQLLTAGKPPGVVARLVGLSRLELLSAIQVDDELRELLDHYEKLHDASPEALAEEMRQLLVIATRRALMRGDIKNVGWALRSLGVLAATSTPRGTRRDPLAETIALLDRMPETELAGFNRDAERTGGLYFDKATKLLYRLRPSEAAEPTSDVPPDVTVAVDDQPTEIIAAPAAVPVPAAPSAPARPSAPPDRPAGAVADAPAEHRQPASSAHPPPMLRLVRSAADNLSADQEITGGCYGIDQDSRPPDH